ncbi:hypothetical protein ALC60_14271 [Trachymyrmex zeteki]|uniref:Uncharacterized protein n=1 Tax=Mycetomoellerius zeteki TaxID=64791 RepID=A0A151WFZ2_9HYME|nr:hypothetical protein ALC60_14271 [Trachymyrmex zeteki]
MCAFCDKSRELDAAGPNGWLSTSDLRTLRTLREFRRKEQGAKVWRSSDEESEAAGTREPQPDRSTHPAQCRRDRVGAAATK